ncbi:FAD-dependent monooxygenase [Streptomyces diacarni]|uniref:FAD-dependent monooxygenase n=1 Tax=Streptomyces diacarni TaxID=2800381 RepID=UPI0015F01697|nr:FAD-dependent monooxygenase [Streptomyces diacarni]
MPHREPQDETVPHRKGSAGERHDLRDAVVVGAGPTGLALAIALRQYALDVLIVDKAPGTKREARASVVWQRGLEALRDLGCAEAFLHRGLPLECGEFHVCGSPAGVQELSMPHTAFPCPVSIEQDDIERLLRARLRDLGPDVRWSSEAVALRPGHDSVGVDLRGPGGRVRTVEARWVVGCEGSHSLVRRSLGLTFDGTQRTGLQCLQLNARPDWSHPGTPHRTRIFVNHRITLITDPVPGGATRFYAFRPDPDPTVEGPPDVAEMTRLVASATGEETVRLEPTEPGWANRARFHDRIAPTLRGGRALLAGDSAHLWAPIGGRGLNTGLLGAHNLGWKLAAVHHGWCPDALLDTYTSEQRRTALDVMRAMRRNVLELPPGRAMLTALRLFLPTALRNRRAARRGALLLSDFGRHYRDSGLSGRRGARTGLRPGDRLPDFPLAGGQGGGLHGLLSYQHWSLLHIGGAEHHARHTERLRELTRPYALPLRHRSVSLRAEPDAPLPEGTVLLVRPDGHLALRVPELDHRSPAAYLDRWSARRPT